MARTIVFDRPLVAKILVNINNPVNRQSYESFLRIKDEEIISEAINVSENDTVNRELPLSAWISQNDAISTNVESCIESHVTNIHNSYDNQEPNNTESTHGSKRRIVSEECSSNKKSRLKRMKIVAETPLPVTESVEISRSRTRKSQGIDTLSSPCKICELSFHGLGGLNLYRETFYQKRNYLCTFCNSSFSNEVELLLHKLKFHKSSVSIPMRTGKIPTSKSSISSQYAECMDTANFTGASVNHGESLVDSKLNYSRLSMIKLDVMINLLKTNRPTCLPSKATGRDSSTKKRRTRFGCYVCDHLFKDKHKLISHYLNVHILRPNHACCICKIELSTRRALYEHLFEHYNYKSTDFRGVKNDFERCKDCRKPVSPNSNPRCNRHTVPEHISQSSQSNISTPESANTDQKDDSRNVTAASIPTTTSLSTEENASMPREKLPRSINNESVPRNKMNFRDYQRTFPNNLYRRRSCTDHLASINNVTRYKRGKCFRKRHKSSNKSLIKRRARRKLNNPNHFHEDARTVCERKLPKIRRTLPVKSCTNDHQHFEIDFVPSKDARSKIKVFKCKSCNFRSRALDTLKLHVTRNYSGGFRRRIQSDHKCKICKLKFRELKNLKSHEKRHSPNGNEICKICGIKFAWKDLLVMHLSSAHNTGKVMHYKLRCNICNEGFHSGKYLRIHYTHFHNIKILKCHLCHVKFDTLIEYKEHVLVHLEKKTMICGICGDSCLNKCLSDLYAGIRRRRSEIAENYNYLCNICKCSFPSELKLQSHTTSCHSEDDIFINQTISVEPDNHLVKRVGPGSKYEEKFKRFSTKPKIDEYFAPNGTAFENSYPSRHKPRIISDRTSINPIAPDSTEKYYICGDLAKNEIIFNAHGAQCRAATAEYHCLVCDTKHQSANDLKLHTEFHHPGVTSVKNHPRVSESVAENEKQSPTNIIRANPLQKNYTTLNLLKSYVKLESTSDSPSRDDNENPEYDDTTMVRQSVEFGAMGAARCHVSMETAFLDVSEYSNDSTGTSSPIVCEICGERFTNFTSMLQHWEICFDADSLKCDQCGALFKSERCFYNHKMNDHAEDNLDPLRICPTRESSSDVSVEVEDVVLKNEMISPKKVNEIEQIEPVVVQPLTDAGTSVISAGRCTRSTSLLTEKVISEMPKILVNPNLPISGERQAAKSFLGLTEITIQTPDNLQPTDISSILETTSERGEYDLPVLQALPNDEAVDPLADSSEDNISDNNVTNKVIKIIPVRGSTVNKTPSYKYVIQSCEGPSASSPETTTYTIIYGMPEKANSTISVLKKSRPNTTTTEKEATQNHLVTVPVTSRTKSDARKRNGCPEETRSRKRSGCKNGGDHGRKDDNTSGSALFKPASCTLEESVDTSEQQLNLNASHRGRLNKLRKSKIITQSRLTLNRLDKIVPNLIDGNGGRTIQGTNCTRKAILQNTAILCAQCGMVFGELQEFKKHMFSHKKDANCSACGLSFPSSEALIQHLPQHKASRCPKCDLVFFYSDQYLQSQGTRNFCSQCKILLQAPTFALNPDQLPISEAFKCGLCMLNFTDMDAASNHFALKHEVMVCGICDEQFCGTTLFLVHVQLHQQDTVESLFACRICGKYFPQMAVFETHMRVHEIYTQYFFPKGQPKTGIVKD